MSEGPLDADLSSALQALATTVIEDEDALDSETDLIRVALVDEFDLEAAAEDGPGAVDQTVRTVLESAAERTGCESAESFVDEALTETEASE